MADAPDLSIVIVNWKSTEFLRKCLGTIYANSEGMSFEIVVVDNASFDGCGEMIRKEFPTVCFIQSEENLGFARANDLGAEHSTGSILLFLNPDTEVIGPALQHMAACLESILDAGAVGPKLLNSDESIQTSCVQSFPSILNQVLDSNYLRAIFPKSRLWGNAVLFEEHHEPVPVDGLSGACLMLRRSTFEKVGHFDGDYFMYGEDMDLCYRIQGAGMRNYYTAEATIIHHGGQSTKRIPDDHFSSILMRESVLKFIRAHHGNGYARVFRSVMALTALCRLGLLGIAMMFPLGRHWRGSVSLMFVKWARVFGWAIGLETWSSNPHNADPT